MQVEAPLIFRIKDCNRNKSKEFKTLVYNVDMECPGCRKGVLIDGVYIWCATHARWGTWFCWREELNGFQIAQAKAQINNYWDHMDRKPKDLFYWLQSDD